jgi:hypothetical protein
MTPLVIYLIIGLVFVGITVFAAIEFFNVMQRGTEIKDLQNEIEDSKDEAFFVNR